MTAVRGSTTYATPNATDLVASRAFRAAPAAVFEAWTSPSQIRRWMLGPPGWTMPVCELDLRPGGPWRYVWRKATGDEMEMSGTVVDVEAPSRFATTERWGPEWPETLNVVEFAPHDAFTILTLTIRYPTREAREAATRTGMTGGLDVSFDRLDALLEAQP